MTFKTLLPALILAGLLLALAAGLRLAEGNGMIDGETARRGVQVAIGLILAAFANRMPKQIRRWRGEQADIREQRAPGRRLVPDPGRSGACGPVGLRAPDRRRHHGHGGGRRSDCAHTRLCLLVHGPVPFDRCGVGPLLIETARRV